MSSDSRSKKDTILIIVTIVLVFALVVGFIVDRNTAVFDRTLKIERTEDMKILHMYKSGTMFYRTSYQAQVQIPSNQVGDMLNVIMEGYGFDAEIYSYDQYVSNFTKVFSGITLEPKPMEGSQVAVLRGEDEEGAKVTFVLSVESQSVAFIYIYYERSLFV